MSIKAFIKNLAERNKPIFTIGLATLILFIGIIIFYRVKPHKETSLTRIGNESSFNVTSEEENGLEDSSNTSFSTDQETENEPFKSATQSIDEEVGILEIEFTSNGFTPKTTRAVQGQAVRWTNKTDKAIFLKQKTSTYEELKESIKIDPEQSFSYRLTQYGTWHYEEDLSKHFGTINVYKVVN